VALQRHIGPVVHVVSIAYRRVNLSESAPNALNATIYGMNIAPHCALTGLSRTVSELQQVGSLNHCMPLLSSIGCWVAVTHFIGTPPDSIMVPLVSLPLTGKPEDI